MSTVAPVPAVRRRRLVPWPASFVPIARARALEDLHFFATEVCGFTLLEDEPHGALCRWLSRPPLTRKRMVFMPRLTFKSTIVTAAYPLWRIAQDPTERLLIDSDLRANAKKFAGLIKRHLEGNPRFIQLFGALRGETGWTEDHFTVLREVDYREPTVMTSGTDQVVVGLHFRRIIADDLVNNTNVGTKEQMEKVLDHIRLFGPLLELEEVDPDVEQIIVGTFWDDADPHRTLLRESGLSEGELTDHLMERETQIGDWEVFFRTAYTDEAGRPVIGASGPRTLFSKFTPQFLDRQQRSMGSYLFSANYLMDPVPAHTATFNPQWFRQWRPPLDEALVDSLVVVMFVDPAISEDKGSSKSAVVVIAADPGKVIYVLRAWSGRVTPLKLIEEIYETYTTYRPHMAGFDAAVFQRVLKHLIDDESARRGEWLPIKEVQPSNRLIWDMRVRGLLQPLYEGGQIFHAHGMGDLELELRRFPKGQTDDLIDALVGCVDLLLPPHAKQAPKEETYRPPENPVTAY